MPTWVIPWSRANPAHHRHADQQHDGRNVHDATIPRPRGASEPRRLAQVACPPVLRVGRRGWSLTDRWHLTRSARVTDVALAAAHRLATGRKNIHHGEKNTHLWEILLLTRMGRIGQLTRVLSNIALYSHSLLGSDRFGSERSCGHSLGLEELSDERDSLVSTRLSIDF